MDLQGLVLGSRPSPPSIPVHEAPGARETRELRSLLRPRSFAGEGVVASPTRAERWNAPVHAKREGRGRRQEPSSFGRGVASALPVVKRPSFALIALILVCAPVALAEPYKVRSPPPLGVAYVGWKGDFRDADRSLEAFKEVGFRIVSFVPTYAYVGLNQIDLASGPEATELAQAIEAAARAGFTIVVMPHLDPPANQHSFDPFLSENPSWRSTCQWRGFFDVDPMSTAYREGIVIGTLRMLKVVLDRTGPAATPPVRLELGAELMNSVVYSTVRWEQLLSVAKKERHQLGLDRRVLLSHDFSHHFEILDDFVGRMSAERRQALKRYIRGLDAISLSQYMDLTAAVPKGERGHRLPSANEVAQALVLHEGALRKEILGTALGLRPGEIPPLHLGEFGIGRGGLRHPSLWAGTATPAQETELAREIPRGYEGLLLYLTQAEGRTARSAVLWVTGARYDIFGWNTPTLANPDAASLIKAALRSP